MVTESHQFGKYHVEHTKDGNIHEFTITTKKLGKLKESYTVRYNTSEKLDKASIEILLNTKLKDLIKLQKAIAKQQDDPAVMIKWKDKGIPRAITKYEDADKKVLHQERDLRELKNDYSNSIADTPRFFSPERKRLEKAIEKINVVLARSEIPIHRQESDIDDDSNIESILETPPLYAPLNLEFPNIQPPDDSSSSDSSSEDLSFVKDVRDVQQNPKQELENLPDDSLDDDLSDIFQTTETREQHQNQISQMSNDGTKNNIPQNETSQKTTPKKTKTKKKTSIENLKSPSKKKKTYKNKSTHDDASLIKRHILFPQDKQNITPPDKETIPEINNDEELF